MSGEQKNEPQANNAEQAVENVVRAANGVQVCVKNYLSIAHRN